MSLTPSVAVYADTISGPFDLGQSVNVSIVRLPGGTHAIMSITGTTVAAATTSTFITFATTLPEGFRPIQDWSFPFQIVDNGTLGCGLLQILSNIMYVTLDNGGVFTGLATLGNTGFLAQSIVYPIATVT